ncbi:hypothetical protein BGX38DRAFT_1270081 [Terfezia claveryi]|nr:hypothetical protein BGX38DRAFT_1270081 [Terfezia claveryi]
MSAAARPSTRYLSLGVFRRPPILLTLMTIVKIQCISPRQDHLNLPSLAAQVARAASRDFKSSIKTERLAILEGSKKWAQQIFMVFHALDATEVVVHRYQPLLGASAADFASNKQIRTEPLLLLIKSSASSPSYSKLTSATSYHTFPLAFILKSSQYHGILLDRTVSTSRHVNTLRSLQSPRLPPHLLSHLSPWPLTSPAHIVHQELVRSERELAYYSIDWSTLCKQRSQRPARQGKEKGESGKDESAKPTTQDTDISHGAQTPSPQATIPRWIGNDASIDSTPPPEISDGDESDNETTLARFERPQKRHVKVLITPPTSPPIVRQMQTDLDRLKEECDRLAEVNDKLREEVVTLRKTPPQKTTTGSSASTNTDLPQARTGAEAASNTTRQSTTRPPPRAQHHPPSYPTNPRTRKW